MGKIYTPAGPEVLALGMQVIAECYPNLLELSSRKSKRLPPLVIDYTMVLGARDKEGNPKGPALKLHGVAALAIIRVVPQNFRARGLGDAEIQIDQDWWTDNGDPERMALLDHELCHLAPWKDADNQWVRDDTGRIQLKLKNHDHDYGWFDEVAKRRGKFAAEVRQARRWFDEFGQIYLLPPEGSK